MCSSDYGLGFVGERADRWDVVPVLFGGDLRSRVWCGVGDGVSCMVYMELCISLVMNRRAYVV